MKKREIIKRMLDLEDDVERMKKVEITQPETREKLSPAENEFRNRTERMKKCEEREWSVGTYCGPKTVSVRLAYDGKTYHRHDFGGTEPRWMRIGRYVTEIEQASGILQDNQDYTESVFGYQPQWHNKKETDEVEQDDSCAECIFVKNMGGSYNCRRYPPPFIHINTIDVKSKCCGEFRSTKVY